MRKRRFRLDEPISRKEYQEAFEQAANRRVRPAWTTRMKESTQRRIEKLLKLAGWLVNRRKS